MIIDIILVIIIAAIALVASRFIPNSEEIQNNETGSYKSKVKLIYLAGAASIAVGVLLLVFFAIDENYQLLTNLGKIVVLMIIGIGLINRNFKISKAVAASEGAAPGTFASSVGTVDAHVVTPATAASVTPVAQTQTAYAVQTPQQSMVQPQVTTQQIGIKGGGTVPVQSQVVARPQPAPQPRIIVIKCPKCQGAMQINTAMLGQKMKCPHCGIEGRIG